MYKKKFVQLAKLYIIFELVAITQHKITSLKGNAGF